MQISLADFDCNKEISLKWYNLLSSSFMESQRNHSALTRSISSVSLESMQPRGGTMQMHRTLESELYPQHQRMRSNSWQERMSLSSQNSTETNSINGSVEQLPLTQPNSYSTLYLQHGRSRSEEGENPPHDANVGRSVSDCTGCRRSFRVPFERMGVGRRSIRQTRLAEIKYQGTQQQTGYSPSTSRRSSNVIPPSQPTMTSIDLEMELEAAYTKQVNIHKDYKPKYTKDGNFNETLQFSTIFNSFSTIFNSFSNMYNFALFIDPDCCTSEY